MENKHLDPKSGSKNQRETLYGVHFRHILETTFI